MLRSFHRSNLAAIFTAILSMGLVGREAMLPQAGGQKDEGKSIPPVFTRFMVEAFGK